MLTKIKPYFQELQQNICRGLNNLGETKNFQQELWEYPQGGGGKTCIIETGSLFERVGVNFSCIYGAALPSASTQRKLGDINHPFVATGVSVVVHPHNPYVPTSHFNVRFISTLVEEKLNHWWFGGGFDLTPYYPFEEDCQHWHNMAKSACLPFGVEVYPQYKQWCDDYFYLKHRNETRGIGGLFFDDLNHWPFETCFEFIQSVATHYMAAYYPIVEKRKDYAFSKEEKEFQLYRRGRYIEFNLVYDRGTLFGLQAGGRAESILMSLPPEAQFKYNWQPKPGSKESKLYEHYLKPREWA